jgi:hypothetical protein
MNCPPPAALTEPAPHSRLSRKTGVGMLGIRCLSVKKRAKRTGKTLFVWNVVTFCKRRCTLKAAY